MIAAEPTVRGDGLELLDPWFLLLGPLAVAVFLGRQWRGTVAALPSASAGLFDGLPKSLRQRVRKLPGVLLSLGAVLLSIALARPVTRELLPLRELGVDILLVIDISGSMRETDQGQESARRSRIEVARERATAFARGRTNDRVGLVTFARYPELRCPLTLDMRALSAFLRAVRPISQQNEEEDGTAIGAALAQATRFLADSQAKSKVVVLLTDGQTTVPSVPVEGAAKLAKDSDIRVHTIGFGTGNYFRDPFGQVMRRPIDFAELRMIADQTKGRFYEAETESALAEVFAEIDALEKVELEDPRYRTVDWFGWPLIAGIGIAALALLLEVLWIREVP